MKRTNSLAILPAIAIGLSLLGATTDRTPARRETAQPEDTMVAQPPAAAADRTPDQQQNVQPRAQDLRPRGEPAGRSVRPIPGGALRMTKEVEMKLGRLPDSQVIEFEGQSKTLGEIRALAIRQLSEGATRLAGREGAPTSQEVIAKLKAQDEARLSAENTKVQEALAGLRSGEGSETDSPRLRAIEEEALAIQNRQATASASQRENDARRVEELYREYQSLTR